MIRRKLSAWFRSHGRELPWRTHPAPYAVLVSEFMLQQTQVATVLPFFSRWMQRFPTLESLARASEEDVLTLWQGLGYYSRARNLHRAAQSVLERFEGRLPQNPEHLASLPGVGAYTAGAIASFAFDLPAPAVDANIARVLARLADLTHPIDSTQGRDFLWEFARRLLPSESGGRAHNSALMELGALLCTPRKPRCHDCPVSTHCHAKDPEAVPRKSPRRKIVPLEENAAWILHDHALLLEQHTGRRAGGLWKLPALASPPTLAPIFQTTYPFTHHKVTLRVFPAPPPPTLPPNQRWFPIHSALDSAPLTAPHRRALSALLAAAENPPAPPLPCPP